MKNGFECQRPGHRGSRLLGLNHSVRLLNSNHLADLRRGGDTKSSENGAFVELCCRSGLGDAILLDGEELLDSLGVLTAYETEVGEVALLLLGLLGEDVALESVFSLDFS